jgi:glycosyltransferase involved in cell wall biosynthesis
MLDQTCMTNDFVIVCDGPLTEPLDAVLEEFSKSYPGVMNIVRLPENVGIGVAANIGLEHCKNDLVAKMDADDLSVATRCEKQLQMFESNLDLAVAGGYIEEFDEDPDRAFSLRVVPITNEEIRRFARRRQPFNNMTVMYRKKAVVAVGGYRDFRRSEDYDMYLRLLHGGYVAANYDGVLVKARVNQSANSRRASWETFKGCVRSRWHAFRIGYSSLWDFMICAGGALVIYLCPNKLQNWLYSRFLRKSSADSQTA